MVILLSVFSSETKSAVLVITIIEHPSLQFLLFQFFQLDFEITDYLFVVFKALIVRDKWLHRRIVSLLLLYIGQIYVKSHWQNIEDVLFLQVTKLLHDVK